jgi:hypothetical protein
VQGRSAAQAPPPDDVSVADDDVVLVRGAVAVGAGAVAALRRPARRRILVPLLRLLHGSGGERRSRKGIVGGRCARGDFESGARSASKTISAGTVQPVSHGVCAVEDAAKGRLDAGSVAVDAPSLHVGAWHKNMCTVNEAGVGGRWQRVRTHLPAPPRAPCAQGSLRSGSGSARAPPRRAGNQRTRRIGDRGDVRRHELSEKG